MKYILFSVIAILLSSCDTIEVTTITTSDGKVGHTLNCNNPGLDMNSCYKKAGEICDASGYKILDQNNEKGGVFTTTDVRLVIECSQ
jgi:hypothetical protein